MSKRAEEAALKEYPSSYSEVNRNAKRIQSYKVDTHKPIRQIYIKGYKQAEKDLSLTWKDVADIVILADTILDGNEEEWHKRGHQAYYEAVLKAFNDKKK